eukprot:m.1075607 g.1075607  ORF g.1075607 m.1075607 type:complete len:792 (+) comp24242_c0_seq8:405-2780(+)
MASYTHLVENSFRIWTHSHKSYLCKELASRRPTRYLVYTVVFASLLQSGGTSCVTLDGASCSNSYTVAGVAITGYCTDLYLVSRSSYPNPAPWCSTENGTYSSGGAPCDCSTCSCSGTAPTIRTSFVDPVTVAYPTSQLSLTLRMISSVSGVNPAFVDFTVVGPDSAGCEQSANPSVCMDGEVFARNVTVVATITAGIATDIAVVLTLGAPTYPAALPGTYALRAQSVFGLTMETAVVVVQVVPTPSPTGTPTDGPTNSPIVGTVSPTSEPTMVPTQDPTTVPTTIPSVSPTDAPTAPTAVPSVEPTDAPTAEPTHAPTILPTQEPTDAPTVLPSQAPTSQPTRVPTGAPTADPTALPSIAPTLSPTESPTGYPTDSPTQTPTDTPTETPSDNPTRTPTVVPTSVLSPSSFATPTLAPTATSSPTDNPSGVPNNEPTTASEPLSQPTVAPTTAPTLFVLSDRSVGITVSNIDFASANISNLVLSLKRALSLLSFDTSKIVNVNVFRGSVVFVVTTTSIKDAEALRSLVQQGIDLDYQGSTVRGVLLSSSGSVANGTASDDTTKDDDSNVAILAITASVIIVLLAMCVVLVIKLWKRKHTQNQIKPSNVNVDTDVSLSADTVGDRSTFRSVPSLLPGANGGVSKRSAETPLIHDAEETVPSALSHSRAPDAPDAPVTLPPLSDRSRFFWRRSRDRQQSSNDQSVDRVPRVTGEAMHATQHTQVEHSVWRAHDESVRPMALVEATAEDGATTRAPKRRLSREAVVHAVHMSDFSYPHAGATHAHTGTVVATRT